jgi:hypothetical protein
MGSPIMVRDGSSGSPRDVSVMMAAEPSLRGKRLRLPNQLVMNSTPPKWMISPGEKTSLGERLPPMAAMNADDGTIGMARGEARCKSPFLACQLSVCFALARYRVVKVTFSCSELVLRTMKNYKAHYSLSCFGPLLQGNSPTSDVFILKKKNSVTMG